MSLITRFGTVLLVLQSAFARSNAKVHASCELSVTPVEQQQIITHCQQTIDCALGFGSIASLYSNSVSPLLFNDIPCREDNLSKYRAFERSACANQEVHKLELEKQTLCDLTFATTPRRGG